MREHTPRNLPWLEQLAIHIPGYGGYLDRGNRLAADRALRDAIAQRLGVLRTRLEQAIRGCVDRNALSEVNSLTRVEQHLDRITQRVRAASSGTEAFYQAPDLKAAEADSLHAFDLALLERAEALVEQFDNDPDLHHDFLANFEAELSHFDHKLDERATRLQGIR
jgi:hypothetical protein